MRSSIHTYWFGNENIGLGRTLFHRFIIPLKPINTGLEYVHQPEITKLYYEWLNLGLQDHSALHGMNLNSSNYPESEASIYLGARHNPIEIDNFFLQNVGPGLFKVSAEMTVLFELEGVARNERFSFETDANFEGLCDE